MRRILVTDDRLEHLIMERDSVRIQISLMGERGAADVSELAALRRKAWKLDEQIRTHQRRSDTTVTY